MSDLAGVARHVLDVARAGVPGWRLVFLAPPGPLPDRLRELGAEVREGALGPAHGLRASVATLRRVVRRERPAVVHTHLAHADVVAALAVGLRLGRGPRLVTTEHGIARDDAVYHRSSARTRAMAAVHAARLRRVDAAIAVSRATADAMADKWRPRTPVTVVPNGLDPVAALPRAPGLRVLSLARLAPEKRLPSLLDAFAVLRHDHPEARLTLAGTGPEDAALREQVERLGLRDAVSLPGFVDPVAAMAEHDVLAMLSVWENCSYALLDAAARGMGVVASDVGGNHEVLPPASLVDAEDPCAVAAALAAQGLDPAVRPTLPDWPTVDDMCARISETYAAAGAR
ncbi:glycosyltransferase [Nocardioides flavus (ex Wang et al. 2016)]|uniref:glycosyltransferase n=1 Tax=Nocardioides flavus (ex Wang et al. 2016) TaxID=2058780 RepID=UPI001E419CC3|nr:glycosyltransferase [Nocardioides flavus (ex Wang et al. 2016)]